MPSSVSHFADTQLPRLSCALVLSELVSSPSDNTHTHIHTHGHTLAIWQQLHKAEMHMLEYIIVELVCVSVCFPVCTHNRLYLCENACGCKPWPWTQIHKSAFTASDISCCFLFLHS